MSFKDSVASDIKNIFLNTDEFGESRTVIYDGETYPDIPVVLTGIQEKDRQTTQSDYGQGLYIATHTLHCAESDIGNQLPEKGTKLRLLEGDFYRDFFIVDSSYEMGMIRLDLQDVSE